MYYNPVRLNQLEQQYANNPLIQSNLSPYQRPQSTYALIHGLSEARSYPVIPNSTCILFDDEKSEFYKKTVDSMGVVDLRLFEYNEKPIDNASPAIASTSDKAELESLKAEINELKSMICQKQTKNDGKSKKSEDLKDAIDF